MKHLSDVVNCWIPTAVSALTWKSVLLAAIKLFATAKLGVQLDTDHQVISAPSGYCILATAQQDYDGRRRFHEVFSTLFRSLTRSKFFENAACVATIDLVRKSSKSEPSWRFLSCLKFCRVSDFWGKFDFWERFCCFWYVLTRSRISRIILLILLSNCQYGHLRSLFKESTVAFGVP